jgi:hypothetical protein
VLPSVKFQLVLPTAHSKYAPHTLVAELSVPALYSNVFARGEGSSLTREVVLTNSLPLMALAVTKSVLPPALQLDEIIREQARDPTCRNPTDLCGPDNLLDFNEAGLLVRKEPIDESLTDSNASRPPA